MQILSATEAISPAWEHSRRLLVEPRNWRIWLKVGLVAFFAQISGCNSNYSSHNGGHWPHPSPAVIAFLTAFAILIAVVGLVLYCLLFYLSSRLQFVFFDMVLRRDTVVGPIWKRYGSATWYWIALKLIFFAIALACLAPFIVPPILHFFHTMPATGTPNTLPFGEMFRLILSMFLVIFIAIAVMMVGYRLLYDFGLPSMALEGTSLGETTARIFRLIRNEPGQIVLYLILYFLLSFAMGIANLILIVLSVLLGLIPFGGVGALLWAFLHRSGTAAYVIMGAGFVVLGVFFLAAIFAVILVLTAWIHTFLQAYALYFLGGRYPLLGEYLQPTPPPPPVPTVVWPPYPPPITPLPIEGEP